MEKISEKIHAHDSSSSSYSDNEKEVKHHSTSPKGGQSAINRLFGRKKHVHHVFGGGKPWSPWSATVLYCVWLFFSCGRMHQPSSKSESIEPPQVSQWIFFFMDLFL